MRDDNCLFCKIVGGDIPSNKLYEDELCYAFYDIAPQAPTHFLVIPKDHIGSVAAGFGTPTSYLPGSGDPLTPNLIPGALDGGGLVSQTGSVNYPVIDTGNGSSSGQNVGYTAVTSDLYYSGGHLGTLKIPAIGLSTKVYEGTDSSTLAKGAGHFPGTSIWDGNCCIAGHNRGVRDDFGDLHTLEPGDSITWTTKLGTRTYQVVSVEKVLETDTSDTASTTDNRITLFTCVRDQQEYRWCVRAVEL